MQEFEDSFEDSRRICSVAAKMMSDQRLVFYSLRISQFAHGITLFDSPRHPGNAMGIHICIAFLL